MKIYIQLLLALIAVILMGVTLFHIWMWLVPMYASFICVGMIYLLDQYDFD